ncbi:exodeoxyribonuclease VII large subunit [Eubacterium oxidoreducens]|uniref:Exodeoxyribonuclease 7 large subunit n=1 Tax=Eubacterium oxidoreducens TaxID=1732 RepID=A0A1G6AJW1_EUBOX|nr:exodeoxyribonuclease VII large subunit [Eubacterium oxidoreducens]SDB08649.1 Exodeoxyribonuclease VII large subunit [Eubacterium oxidoreducens]
MRQENIYTVSQINKYIAEMFAQDYLLKNVLVKGEISQCTYHSSGHIYFTIKDSESVMNGIMYKSVTAGLKFRLKTGDRIVVKGKVNTYAPRGTYSIVAASIEKQGAGDLHAQFEQLKAELEEMGMFDSLYKRPIPKYVFTVGVVTSATGAAIRDIINVASRRNPYVQIILYHAQVQGEGAAASIAEGILAMESVRPDVLIVGRGGGSMEDLWAFNERVVAEAIFNCTIPVISAVGHEIDTTIADYVADLRAPTPSAAAELAIFDYQEFHNKIENLKYHLLQGLQLQVEKAKYQYSSINSRLQKYNPNQQILLKRKYEKELRIRLVKEMERLLVNNKHRLQLYAERFDGQSPMRKLTQGYSYVTDQYHHMVNDVTKVKEQDELYIRMTNGTLKTSVIEIKEETDE